MLHQKFKHDMWSLRSKHKPRCFLAYYVGTMSCIGTPSVCFSAWLMQMFSLSTQSFLEQCARRVSTRIDPVLYQKDMMFVMFELVALTCWQFRNSWSYLRLSCNCISQLQGQTLPSVGNSNHCCIAIFEHIGSYQIPTRSLPRIDFKVSPDIQGIIFRLHPPGRTHQYWKFCDLKFHAKQKEQNVFKHMSMLLHSTTFPHLVCRRKTLPTKSQKLLESHDHVWQPPNCV